MCHITLLSPQAPGKFRISFYAECDVFKLNTIFFCGVRNVLFWIPLRLLSPF